MPLDFESAYILQPNPRIKTLCTYIEEHYAENLTLDDLLAMTDFGKSYLLRILYQADRCFALPISPDNKAG